MSDPRLAALPEPLRPYHQKRRILVVDDLAYTLHEIGRDLAPFYPETSGNLVELEPQATAVVDRVRAAAESGRPYDAIVLDLSMPEKNGDCVLRELAQAGLLLPTVIHSGSHAAGFQACLLPQIDELRTEAALRRLEGVAELDKALSSTPAWPEHLSVRDELVRLTDGIPLRFVRKYGNDYAPEQLMRALDAVMITGEETNWENFQTAVMAFRPRIVDVGVSTAYCEELSEIVRFVGKRSRDMKALFEREVPDIRVLGGEMWGRFVRLVKDLGSIEYSVEGLAEEQNEEGARRRHKLPSVVNHPGMAIEFLSGLRPGEDTVELIASRPDLVERAREFGATCRACYDIVCAIKDVRRTPKTVKLEEVLARSLRDTQVDTVKIETSEITIMGFDSLPDGMIEQLVLNAQNAVEGLPNARVTVTVDKKSMAHLSEEGRKHFKKLGFQYNDHLCFVRVEDNGPGIPVELRDRIFELGFTTRRGGTGFGLAYVKRFLGIMNGFLELQSEVGKGSAFTLYFPPAPD